VQVRLGKAPATILLSEILTAHRLDGVNRAKVNWFPEVLEQEGAQLLIFHGPARQVSGPVIGIADSRGWYGWYAADLAAYAAKGAPLTDRERMGDAVEGNAGHGFRIVMGFDIQPDSEKSLRPIPESSRKGRRKVGTKLVDEKTHAYHIREERPFQHAEREVGIE